MFVHWFLEVSHTTNNMKPTEASCPYIIKFNLKLLNDAGYNDEFQIFQKLTE